MTAPRCSECKRFMPWNRSKIVRHYDPPPCEGARDEEIGLCKKCEDRISEELAYINSPHNECVFR